jgi:hypothetical protein
MPISRGSTSILDIRRGATAINEVRRGATLLWARTGVVDTFDRSDADTLGANWVAQGAATYAIGIENRAARVRIPEGQIGGFFSLSTSRMRWSAGVAGGDDGYVECVPVSLGSAPSGGSPGGYLTEVFRRVSNSAFTHGVGIQLAAGQLSIVRRVASVDTVMVTCGSFQPGDVVRLTQAVNVHTMTRNGMQVGQWNDSGATALKGATYRSLGIRGDGAKDLLGPRRFSPALDYVMMG